LDPENSSPKAVVHTKFCKRSRCLEENPVFLFLSKKKNKTKMKKKEFSPSLQITGIFIRLHD
jgi:hypothetical protein